MPALPLAHPALAAYVKELQLLILSGHPVIVIETAEEERVQRLLQLATQDMGMQLLEWTVTTGLVRSPVSSTNRWTNEYAPPGSTNPVAVEGTTAPQLALQAIQEMRGKAIFWLKDFAIHLEEPAVARQFRELEQVFAQTASALILSGPVFRLPQQISPSVVYFDLKLPSRQELQQMLREQVVQLKSKHNVRLELTEPDTAALVRALSGMTLRQARQAVAYAALEDGRLSGEDLPRIIQRKTQILREQSLIDYLPVPSVSPQLGGFAGLKQWLAQAKCGFSPQAQAMQLDPPKGVLIVGMQGCGKSLAAKVIAHEWQMPLLKFEAGRLYDKYVGESEKNFRQAIAVAESMAPAVLWIDEIEKALGSSSSEDTDGGLSQRLFGAFLTWMQEKSQEVFVVATANDLFQLPPELLRKGRFDEIFYVDLPDAEERLAIWQIHLQRRQQHPQSLDLATLVTATTGFSGAEIEQVVIAGLYQALYLNQPLSTSILQATIQATVPLSVSRREDLAALQAATRDRFVNVR